MKPRGLWIVALPLLVLLASARPSWAWRGGWGWHGRWWWPSLGLYVGSGPYWDYPYYPYYDPYNYPPPYAYPPYGPSPESSADTQAPENSQHDSKATRAAQASRERAQVEYDYADGDISEAERDARLREIDERAKQAPAETSAKPAAQPAARRDLATVTDLHLELRTLLDQKLKEGNITQSQHAAEAKYLDQIDQEAHTAASANGGALSADQERAFVQQLHKAYYAINHDLISHD